MKYKHAAGLEKTSKYFTLYNYIIMKSYGILRICKIMNITQCKIAKYYKSYGVLCLRKFAAGLKPYEILWMHKFTQIFALKNLLISSFGNSPFTATLIR